jgi:hypothetical protein
VCFSQFGRGKSWGFSIRFFWLFYLGNLHLILPACVVGVFGLAEFGRQVQVVAPKV